MRKSRLKKFVVFRKSGLKKLWGCWVLLFFGTQRFFSSPHAKSAPPTPQPRRKCPTPGRSAKKIPRRRRNRPCQIRQTGQTGRRTPGAPFRGRIAEKPRPTAEFRHFQTRSGRRQGAGEIRQQGRFRVKISPSVQNRPLVLCYNHRLTKGGEPSRADGSQTLSGEEYT